MARHQNRRPLNREAENRRNADLYIVKAKEAIDAIRVCVPVLQENIEAFQALTQATHDHAIATMEYRNAEPADKPRRQQQAADAFQAIMDADDRYLNANSQAPPLIEEVDRTNRQFRKVALRLFPTKKEEDGWAETTLPDGLTPHHIQGTRHLGQHLYEHNQRLEGLITHTESIQSRYEQWQEQLVEQGLKVRDKEPG